VNLKLANLALPLGLAFAVLQTSAAHATLADCGNVDIKANAQCKVEVAGGCTAMCTPISVQASCAADLYVGCQGMCNASAEASCTASCDLSACKAKCDVTPATFDCSANCTLRAEGMCDASCSAAADKTQCVASCKATASGECDASCKVVRPEVNCSAKCEAACQGECKAKANVNCQLTCQTKGSVDCELEVEGKCEAQCRKPEVGALFCDGKYVDTNNNGQKCIDALKAQLAISVDVSSRGSASCVGNSCNAEGEASASCSASPARGDKVSLGVLGLLGLALGGTAWRRTRRSH